MGEMELWDWNDVYTIYSNVCEHIVKPICFYLWILKRSSRSSFLSSLIFPETCHWPSPSFLLTSHEHLHLPPFTQSRLTFADKGLDKPSCNTKRRIVGTADKLEPTFSAPSLCVTLGWAPVRHQLISHISQVLHVLVSGGQTDSEETVEESKHTLHAGWETCLCLSLSSHGC